MIYDIAAQLLVDGCDLCVICDVIGHTCMEYRGGQPLAELFECGALVLQVGHFVHLQLPATCSLGHGMVLWLQQLMEKAGSPVCDVCLP